MKYINKCMFKYIALLLFVIISTVLIYNSTFFYKEYKTFKNEEITIPIPLFSYYKRLGGMYGVTFYTLRSKTSIDKVKNNYLNNLEKMSCHGNIYYYDNAQDITIWNYSSGRHHIFNTIYIGYSYGKDC